MKKCTVEGCSSAHNAKGLCNAHYNRMKRHGSLDKRVRRQAGSANNNYVGDQAAYTTVHSRLRSQRGKASQQVCVECSAVAEDWAYMYGCPNDKQSKFGPYSTDLSQYQPMCRPCHKVFDYHAGQVPA